MVFETQKVLLIQTVASIFPKIAGFQQGLIMLMNSLVSRCYNLNSFIFNCAKFSELTLGVMFFEIFCIRDF